MRDLIRQIKFIDGGAVMDGYELAEEVYKNIGERPNHDVSVDDCIRVISFWGFNEEAEEGKIAFVCRCARDKIKKAFEQALVYGHYSQLDDLMCKIDDKKVSGGR